MLLEVMTMRLEVMTMRFKVMTMVMFFMMWCTDVHWNNFLDWCRDFLDDWEFHLFVHWVRLVNWHLDFIWNWLLNGVWNLAIIEISNSN